MRTSCEIRFQINFLITTRPQMRTPLEWETFVEWLTNLCLQPSSFFNGHLCRHLISKISANQHVFSAWHSIFTGQCVQVLDSLIDMERNVYLWFPQWGLINVRWVFLPNAEFSFVQAKLVMWTTTPALPTPVTHTRRALTWPLPSKAPTPEGSHVLLAVLVTLCILTMIPGVF